MNSDEKKNDQIMKELVGHLEILKEDANHIEIAIECIIRAISAGLKVLVPVVPVEGTDKMQLVCARDREYYEKYLLVYTEEEVAKNSGFDRWEYMDFGGLISWLYAMNKADGICFNMHEETGYIPGIERGKHPKCGIALGEYELHKIFLNLLTDEYHKNVREV